MADIWVPFVAAFAAAAIALVIRQILMLLTARVHLRAPRRASARPPAAPIATISPARLDFSKPARTEMARTDMARTDVVRTAPPSPEPTRAGPIIIGAPAKPIIIGAPIQAAEASPSATARSDAEWSEPEMPHDESARRLRVAVGPGRVSTTIGADTQVWSKWTQEIASPADATPGEETAQQDSDEDCPHCASARYRGARFCGRCGRHLSDAVAITG